MNPNHAVPPKGNPADIFEKGGQGKFSSDLQNLAYGRDMAKKQRNWCIAIIGLCVVSVVLIATTFNYKTYVVRVDNATGAVETGGQLKTTNYQPQEVEVKHFLFEWIKDVRGVPMDPIQFKRNVDTAQHFMTQEAAQKYAGIIQGHNPVAKLGKSTVIPELRSIQLQPGSKNVYQVRWSETDFSMSGAMSDVKVNYVALFTVAVDPPKDEKELLINPLGLKITDLTMSVESQSQIAPEPKAPASQDSTPTSPITTTGGGTDVH